MILAAFLIRAFFVPFFVWLYFISTSTTSILFFEEGYIELGWFSVGYSFILPFIFFRSFFSKYKELKQINHSTYNNIYCLDGRFFVLILAISFCLLFALSNLKSFYDLYAIGASLAIGYLFSKYLHEYLNYHWNVAQDELKEQKIEKAKQKLENTPPPQTVNIRLRNNHKHHRYMPKWNGWRRTPQNILDRYEDMSRRLEPEELGVRYERYIGYLYEMKGFEVTYNGAIKGKLDDGVDIIAKRYGTIKIIQCKNYKEGSQIHSNTIRQLHSNLIMRQERSNCDGLAAILFSTHDNLDEQAKEVLAQTKIEHIVMPYDNNYPKIKCNINKNGEKIYHLPGVGMYDRIKITTASGERYVKTIAEAEALGFRAAKHKNNFRKYK